MTLPLFTPPPAGETPQHKGLLALEIKDADRGTIEAVFSRFEVKDHDGDYTLPAAFTDGAPVRISAYGHTTWHGHLPVGRGKIKTTDTDARLVGRFFVSTPHGRATFDTVREMGELQEWSYGFDVDEVGEVSDELAAAGVVRVLKRLTVHEVSPVLLGAGVGTHTVSVKQYQAERAAEAAAVEAAVAAEAAQAAARQRVAREHMKFIKTARTFGRFV